MKVAAVTLTRQASFIAGRFTRLEVPFAQLTELAHGVKIAIGPQTVLIPWHSIESVEYESS